MKTQNKHIFTNHHSAKLVRVAVGVIKRNDQVLLAKRKNNVHLPGLWEFPGGKIEKAELPRQALIRELDEELNIVVKQCRPLISIEHQYTEKSVLLDVWLVEQFEGEPEGNEGQAIEWVAVDDLDNVELPEADNGIVKAIRMPEKYLITPDIVDEDELMNGLNKCLENNIKLVQLRLPSVSYDQYLEFAENAREICQLSGAKLYVNGPIDFMKDCKVDGIHLNSQRLKQEYLKISKKQSMIKLSASCHNLNEIKMAEKLNCEFAVLSPVRPTKSHPGKKPLGWKKFQQMVEQCNIPVYALGGVSESDLEKSWNCGGQGIAAISGLWLGH